MPWTWAEEDSHPDRLRKVKAIRNARTMTVRNAIVGICWDFRVCETMLWLLQGVGSIVPVW